VWRRSKTTQDANAASKSAEEATREALEHCWDDVSSLRMLGASPLSDLAGESSSASAAGRARSRGPGHRWSFVMVTVVVVTLAVTIAETLLGR
jgi:hypothetical protein